MRAKSWTVLSAMIIAVLLIAAVPVFFDLPSSTLVWSEIQNTGHTPLFGIIALLMLGISRRLLKKHFPGNWFHYAVALVITGLLGIVTEYVQMDGPRDADLWDFVRDMAGAVSFLGIYMYFDVRFGQKQAPAIGGLHKMILVLSILILIGASTPLAFSINAHLGRNNSFPVICDFNSYWTKRFLTTNSAQLKIVSPPEPMSASQGKVGELTLCVGDYPGFGIREPYPDWQNYRFLKFDIYSPLDSSVTLIIRVDDLRHNGDFYDRFNRSFRVMPGENHFAIALDDIRSAPKGRQMDMGSIATVHIFCGEISQPFILYFDNIRLEL